MSDFKYYKNKAGKRVPRCTTILKQLGWGNEQLLAWAKREAMQGKDPDMIKQEAADIGTLVHNMIEHHIYGADKIDTEGYPIEYITTAAKGFSEYIDWELESGVEYLESELPVISELNNWGGTVDGIVLLGGKTVVLDFKTSNNLYPKYIAQLGAYRDGIHETTDYRIDYGLILHIKKYAEHGMAMVVPKVISPLMLDYGSEAFNNCLRLSYIEKEATKWLKQ